MRIIRFIHQLPVRMGLVKRMEDYYWSSYWAYLDDRKQIDTGELMGQLGTGNMSDICGTIGRTLFCERNRRGTI